MAPLKTLLTTLLALTTTSAFVCNPADTQNGDKAAIFGIPCPATPVGGPLNPAIFASEAAAAATATAPTTHRAFEIELMRSGIAEAASSISAAVATARPTLEPLEARMITPLRNGVKTFRRPVPGRPVYTPTTLVSQVEPEVTAEMVTGNVKRENVKQNLAGYSTFPGGYAEVIGWGEERDEEWEKVKRELERIVEDDGTVEIGSPETGYWKVNKREVLNNNGVIEMGSPETGYWKLDKGKEE